MLDLAGARQSALALTGPERRYVFPEVPHAWIAETVREGIDWHDTSDRPSPNRVLNTIRAWHWSEEDRFASKTPGAHWAFARTGDPLIHDALRIRATGTGHLDAAAVDAFVRRIRPEITRH